MYTSEKCLHSFEILVIHNGLNRLTENITQNLFIPLQPADILIHMSQIIKTAKLGNFRLAVLILLHKLPSRLNPAADHILHRSNIQ